METTTLTLPAHWASALVNADFSGMSNREIVEVENWQDNNTHNSPVDVSRESGFVAYHDAVNVLPAECLEYTFESFTGKDGVIHLV